MDSTLIFVRLPGRSKAVSRSLLNSLWKIFKSSVWLLVISLVLWGCASFREPERPTPLQTEREDPRYSWSSFFNNGCGPTLQFKLNSEDEAILNYQCSTGKALSQFARRHKRLRDVDLWAASDLSLEQLYQLSNSKCRASLIYLGPAHATIEFPCALIHMTVSYNIVSGEKSDDVTLVQLEPSRALIIYSDGTQEFRVEEERLTPLGPFKPFKTPRPLFTHDLKKNRALTAYRF